MALLVFLKSLPPGCYFNIVGFGSTFALLFPEYVLLCNLPGLLEYCSFQFTKVLYIPVAVANSDWSYWKMKSDGSLSLTLLTLSFILLPSCLSLRLSPSTPAISYLPFSTQISPTATVICCSIVASSNGLLPSLDLLKVPECHFVFQKTTAMTSCCVLAEFSTCLR